MNTSVERIDAHTVRLTVGLTAEEVDAAIDDAYRRIGQKVKAPGFRAGKAPKPIIDSQVGRDAVIAEAQEALVTDRYGEALGMEGLRPIEQPEMGELDMIEPGREFEFVAEVQVRPELTLSSIKDLTIEVPPTTASEREIDAQIDHLREKFATIEPVEGRGIAEKDFVLMTFTGRIDGEEYEGNSVDRYLYELGRGLMPREFEEGILGANPGDELRIEFPIPETSSVPEYIGKSATFDVTIHEVKEKVLPELTDELASNIGGFATVEEMRENTRQDLDRTKLFANRRARESNARAALAERLEGE
ncbi:MAG: trigger factor, partial [Coriobacteriia bacterium]|nr:trigger factor [Coriobacteriia bacterium]